ncbi:MAG: 3-phosphoshikimate 1-carboxyvinyltransferase, partial [bacterium]
CKNQKNFNGEPVADLTVKTQRLKAAVIKNPLIPKIIDEIPILAIAATQAQGETKILDAGELRVKETDRIHALYVNLTSMGARVTEVKDGLVIQGPTELRGTEIETFGDHRIAMAFTVAGLIAQGITTIKNSECAEISFPGFYKTLESVYV